MASTDPFIPSSPLPVDPEDALADLEADFEGITSPPDIILVPEDVPPIGRSWGFAFIGDGFLLSGAGPVSTYDLSTLIQWAEKCLRNPRGSHPIHPPGYGIENPDILIGDVLSSGAVSQLESAIQDALTFHPRIMDVIDFAFDYDPADEWIAVSFALVLDDDRNVTINTTLTATTVATAEF